MADVRMCEVVDHKSKFTSSGQRRVKSKERSYPATVKLHARMYSRCWDTRKTATYWGISHGVLCGSETSASR
jgi:hypothetical protein